MFGFGDAEAEAKAHVWAAQGKEQTLVVYLHPLTGAQLAPPQVVPVKLVQAAMAPLVTKSHSQVVVAMDTEQRVHVFPDAPEAKEKFLGLF